jgi:hypothetical protein
MLVEIEPGRFVVARDRGPVARSDLPMPMVIGDEMPPTEQVDGRYYTSKAAFRAVGRAHGLTEVGTEKFKPRERPHATLSAREGRRKALITAKEKYQAGYRVRTR